MNQSREKSIDSRTAERSLIGEGCFDFVDGKFGDCVGACGVLQEIVDFGSDVIMLLGVFGSVFIRKKPFEEGFCIKVGVNDNWVAVFIRKGDVLFGSSFLS